MAQELREGLEITALGARFMAALIGRSLLEHRSLTTKAVGAGTKHPDQDQRMHTIQI